MPGPSERSWLTPGRLSLLQWHLPLGLPDPAPATLLRLRCVLPVVFSSRRAEPLVVPLADAVGKTFRHPAGMVVTVDRVAPQGSQSTEVSLTLAAGEASAVRDRDSTGAEPDPVTNLARNRLEFQDDDGRAVNWLLPFDPTPGRDGTVKLRVNVSGSRPPARLLVYRLRRQATEVTVEFGGVPWP